MTSLWVIIRSEELYSGEYPPPPTVCGIYSSKEEAVEEILKLYIEDDIDLVSDTKDKTKDNTDDRTKDNTNDRTDRNKTTDNTNDDDEFDYRPTSKIIKEHRQRLLEDEYTTYTNLGNLYTLVECILGAKHDFGEDVLKMYKLSKPSPK